MKNLLTTLLIVMLAFAVGTASAGDLTYDLYGKLHSSLNYKNDGDNTTLSLSSNNSYFGVKGGVELNENFTAMYQFESRINIAQKMDLLDGLANRNSYLGLKGKWGSLLAGIYDTPVKTLGRKVTFFEDQVGDPRAALQGFDMRLQDIIVYTLPKLESGFGAQLAYQLDQNDYQATDTAGESLESAYAFSGMAYWHNEQFFVGAGYETWGEGYYQQIAGNDPIPDGVSSPGAVRVAAKYDAEQFAVSGLFQTVSNHNFADGVTSQNIGFEALFRAAEKWNLKGLFHLADPNTDADDDGWNQIALGVDHVFAPRTTLYLQWAMVTNDDGQAWGLGGPIDGMGYNGWGDDVFPYQAGESPMAITVGAIHSF